ncbi:hypothetical protein ACJ41O_010290 [Fusarium nematophilum]
MSSKLRFDNRVAIVTGAGAGMGLEHALRLGRRGAHVIINDLVPETADAAAQEIIRQGGSAVAVAGSIADRAVAEALVDTAIKSHGRIDILVNNAGIEIKKDFADFTDVDVSRVMGVHFVGSWTLTQLAWPHMIKQKYGRVLFVSSTSLFGMAKNAAYVSAKGALFGLGRALATEGAEHGIQVNCFGPTAFTAMAKQMIEDDEAQAQWMERTLPPTTPSAVCAWLVHEDCKRTGEFITAYGRSFGQIIFGETRGAYCPEGDFEPETVRDHLEEACERTGFITPSSVGEQMSLLLAMRAPGGDSASHVEAAIKPQETN